MTESQRNKSTQHLFICTSCFTRGVPSIVAPVPGESCSILPSNKLKCKIAVDCFSFVCFLTFSLACCASCSKIAAFVVLTTIFWLLLRRSFVSPKKIGFHGSIGHHVSPLRRVVGIVLPRLGVFSSLIDLSGGFHAARRLTLFHLTAEAQLVNDPVGFVGRRPQGRA